MKEQLLTEFEDVFDSCDTLKPMRGPPMKIHLREEYEPFRMTAARPIPFAQREKVKGKLDEMLKKQIIAPLGDEPTEWCHPLVIVPKENDDVRICVDLSKLNKFIDRPIYPTTSPADAVNNVTPGSEYFTKMDAKQGYW